MKEVMKNTYRYWINNGVNGFYYNFKSFKVYWAYREFITESLTESNFIQKAISNGFIPDEKDFTPNSNWFGVSKQHPDVILNKDNRTIVLSLNGCLTPYSINENGKKYICFKENNKIIYESFFGELPSVEFIESFILEEDIFDKSVFDKLKQSVNELKKIELKVNSSFEYNLNKSFENLKKKIK